MRFIKKSKEEGLSLRLTFLFMMGFSIAVTVILLFMTYHTIRSFHELALATDNYIELEDTAASLMDASDYLTEEAQCYTVMGDRKYLDNYFDEVDTVRRREEAVAVMKTHMPDSAALSELEAAMSRSVRIKAFRLWARTNSAFRF